MNCRDVSFFESENLKKFRTSDSQVFRFSDSQVLRFKKIHPLLSVVC